VEKDSIMARQKDESRKFMKNPDELGFYEIEDENGLIWLVEEDENGEWKNFGNHHIALDKKIKDKAKPLKEKYEKEKKLK